MVCQFGASLVAKYQLVKLNNPEIYNKSFCLDFGMGFAIE